MSMDHYRAIGRYYARRLLPDQWMSFVILAMLVVGAALGGCQR